MAYIRSDKNGSLYIYMSFNGVVIHLPRYDIDANSNQIERDLGQIFLKNDCDISIKNAQALLQSSYDYLTSNGYKPHIQNGKFYFEKVKK